MTQIRYQGPGAICCVKQIESNFQGKLCQEILKDTFVRSVAGQSPVHLKNVAEQTPFSDLLKSFSFGKVDSFVKEFKPSVPVKKPPFFLKPTAAVKPAHTPSPLPTRDPLSFWPTVGDVSSFSVRADAEQPVPAGQRPVPSKEPVRQTAGASGNVAKLAQLLEPDIVPGLRSVSSTPLTASPVSSNPVGRLGSNDSAMLAGLFGNKSPSGGTATPVATASPVVATPGASASLPPPPPPVGVGTPPPPPPPPPVGATGASTPAGKIASGRWGAVQAGPSSVSTQKTPATASRSSRPLDLSEIRRGVALKPTSVPDEIFLEKTEADLETLKNTSNRNLEKAKKAVEDAKGTLVQRQAAVKSCDQALGTARKQPRTTVNIGVSLAVQKAQDDLTNARKGENKAQTDLQSCESKLKHSERYAENFQIRFTETQHKIDNAKQKSLDNKIKESLKKSLEEARNLAEEKVNLFSTMQSAFASVPVKVTTATGDDSDWD